MPKKKNTKPLWKDLSYDEQQKLINDAKITDNFVFLSLMKREKFAKKILEIVLGVKIKKIDVFEYEKTIDLKFGKKSIRMDVYLEGSNVVYNIEMQVEDKYNLILRSRYYGSLLDLSKLEKGQDYTELPASYVIFICMFDPFNKGQAKYVFTNQCKLDNGEYIEIGDKAYKIFLNAKDFMNTKDKKLRDLLEYIATQQLNSNFIKEIHEEIETIKLDEKWRLEFMTFMTNYLDDMRSFEKEIALRDETIKKEQAARKKEQLARQKEQAARKKEQATYQKEQAARKKEQATYQKEQAARKKEQLAYQKEQAARKQALIKQLEMLDDSIVAQINCMSLEEVAKLRIELLGE